MYKVIAVALILISWSLLAQEGQAEDSYGADTKEYGSSQAGEQEAMPEEYDEDREPTPAPREQDSREDSYDSYDREEEREDSSTEAYDNPPPSRDELDEREPEDEERRNYEENDQSEDY